MLRNYILNDHVEVSEEQAEQLQRGPPDRYTVEVHPPASGDVPATVETFVRGISEFQTKLFKLKNTSPLVTYEIVRPQPDRLRFQYSVPTKRLERKVRTHMAEMVDGVSFNDGISGLPVFEGDTLGGGFLSPGRLDHYPLQTEFDKPPMDSVAAALHPDGMGDTRFVIQLLFRPMGGRSVKRLMWKKSGYRRRNYLEKEKEGMWETIQPTRRERRQAAAVDDKVSEARFTVTIRILVIGAGEYTRSRLKEISGGFNAFEDDDTGQYLNIETVTPLRKRRLISFADTVRRRRFRAWSRSFHATPSEMAGLLSLPDTRQNNIQYAAP